MVFLPRSKCLLKVISVLSDSVWSHKWQPNKLRHPWDSPGKNTGVGCRFLLQCVKMKSESEVVQSCLTLSDPIDCSLPGFSTHRILQARVLEWGVIAFSERRLSIKELIFWTVVLQKTLESPLECKEIKPMNLQEISPEYSLEGLMLKLKLQCFGHLMRKADSLETSLVLGKMEAGGEGDDRGCDIWMASLTQRTVWASFKELVIDWETWHSAVRGVRKSQTQLSDWTHW